MNLRAKAVSSFMSQGSRKGQEDYLLMDREKGIFVVADGFGGPIPGAEAARVACEAVRNFLFKEAGDLDATLPFELRNYFSLAGNVLFNSIIYANRKVTSLNKNKNVHEKGGASVLACFIDGDLLAIANVGGCSAWLVREGRTVELVMPRTYGKLCDPFASEGNPAHQVPLISLGTVDNLEPEIFEYRLRRGDCLVLCSDGLRNGVSEKLANLQSKKLNSEEYIQNWTRILKQEQFDDNAAVLLAIF